MKYYLYILKSLSKKYFYKGITNNLRRRIEQHNNGSETTTKPYRPFKLLLVIVYDNRKLARLAEKYFKTGAGREIIGKLAEVAELADA